MIWLSSGYTSCASAIAIHAPKVGIGLILIKQSRRLGIAKRLKRNGTIVGELVQAARKRSQVSGLAGRRLARQQAGADHQRGEDLPQLVDRACLCALQHFLAGLPTAHSIPKRRTAA